MEILLLIPAAVAILTVFLVIEHRQHTRRRRGPEIDYDLVTDSQTGATVLAVTVRNPHCYRLYLGEIRVLWPGAPRSLGRCPCPEPGT